MAPWLAGTVRVPHPNCMQHAMGVMDIMIQPQPCQRRSTRHGVWNGAIASVCDKRMSMADLSILDARWGEYTHTYIGSRMHMHVYMPEGSSIYPMQPNIPSFRDSTAQSCVVFIVSDRERRMCCGCDVVPTFTHYMLGMQGQIRQGLGV